MCVERRFKSVCASTQSDQSVSFLPEETLDLWLPTECPFKDSDQIAQADLSLRWAHMSTFTFCGTAAQLK